jgi:SNF2 family DNA or RNA helicase
MHVGNVELRPYQARDVERFLQTSGCLVAYDKRGGKSITALALAYNLMDRGVTGPILIISDKTSPWIRDLRKIGTDLRNLHLVDRPKCGKWRDLVRNPCDGNVYQIHWAGLARNLDVLQPINWAVIIADEAHAAKNRNSQRTKALKRLRTRFKIGLTADPDDNVPQDIWSLLNWIRPKQYTSYWKWIRKHIEVEELEGRNGAYFSYGAPINVDEFRREISEFFVSMTLEEIDPGQIPVKFEERAVTMTPEQEKSYREMVDWQMMMMGDDLIITEYPMVAAMRLQQLAQAYGIAEVRQVWRTYRELDENTGKMVKVRKKVDTTTIHQVEPSPKLDALMQIISDIPKYGPTIIFSQYPGMVKLAMKRMDDAGIKYSYVLNNEEVNESERRFQEGEVDIIIGTTGHISESIELDRADTEVFIDCPWNPRVRGQAIGRGKAVGKRRPLTVIDIRTRSTVDYARLDRVRTKQEWKDEFLGRNYRAVVETDGDRSA